MVGQTLESFYVNNLYHSHLLLLLLLLLLLDEMEVELEIRQKQSYSSCVKGQLSVLS